jgi:hypothetical protein
MRRDRYRAAACVAVAATLTLSGGQSTARASEDEIRATFAEARAAIEAGRYESAAELSQRALDQARKELGDEHPDTVMLAYNTGQLYAELQVWTRAEAALELALPGYAKLHGDTSPRLLPVVERLLAVYRATADLDGSIAMLERNLAIAGVNEGQESAAAAGAMRALADMLVYKGGDSTLRRAGRLARAARRIYAEALGEASASVGETYLVTARVALAEGNFASAVEDRRKGLAVLEAALPEGDPRLIALYRIETARVERFAGDDAVGPSASILRQLREDLARHEAAAAAGEPAGGSAP